LLLVGPVLALGLGVGGYFVYREATAPPPAAAVDTSACEKLLTSASTSAPGKFLVCASRAKIVYRLVDGQRQPLSLLANAVYELPIDGRTRIEGLSSPDMRYGYRGGYCEHLSPSAENKTFLLNAAPVDKASCLSPG
jgi:hypothetical protein